MTAWGNEFDSSLWKDNNSAVLRQWPTELKLLLLLFYACEFVCVYRFMLSDKSSQSKGDFDSAIRNAYKRLWLAVCMNSIGMFGALVSLLFLAHKNGPFGFGFKSHRNSFVYRALTLDYGSFVVCSFALTFFFSTASLSLASRLDDSKVI